LAEPERFLVQALTDIVNRRAAGLCCGTPNNCTQVAR